MKVATPAPSAPNTIHPNAQNRGWAGWGEPPCTLRHPRGQRSGYSWPKEARPWRALMRLRPIRPASRIHNQRHVQLDRRFRGALHHVPRNFDGCVQCRVLNLKDQFVVHLQQHLGGQVFDRVWHPDHRTADDVGGGALDRRIYGCAIGKARPRPFGIDLRRVDLAAKQRLHIAMLFGKGFGVIHIGANAREALKIAVDEVLRLASRNTQIPRQTKA
mmetsp:Transcript_7899/g.13575  ORF Transcript_7899/g.13575 Transcript_7899/m.13575 type:complete len:216 (+) Transcript_7899:342-989(+)